MSLTVYRQKRHFKSTPESRGTIAKGNKAGSRYIIQKHDASRLHYDFRLELDGTLKSWAVPKGPSLDPARKALAVQVEDHPIEYAEFEGVIPQGQYGGGTVLLWDQGTWEPLHDPREGYAHGKLHFVLHGEKLHGEWSLVRMHGRAGEEGKNWLLMKVNDRYASKTRDIQADAPKSVKTKRDLEAIADDRKDVWSKEAEEVSHLTSARKSAMPKFFSPQLAVLSEHPPAGEQWLHEIKFDGYRLLAFIKAGKVTLYTRKGLDWTSKFPGVARGLAKMKADSAIVDGEVVVLDSQGRSDFHALQASIKDGSEDRVFYVFDLPFCDGVDLRAAPLTERKETLEKLLKRSQVGQKIRYSEHVRGDGSEVVKKACGMALEGIISKRADAPYLSHREPTWLKSKCGNRQEFVVIGYTDPHGARNGFGSLLLGYNKDGKGLVYAGRVGTGFDQTRLREMYRQLRAIARKDYPTESAPPPRERRAAHWVEPKLVAEISFSNWTPDGRLRHPVFLALRSDKPAREVKREKPVAPEKIKSNANGHNNGKHAHKTGGDMPEVKLTHPDKLLYPREEITKQNLADYYRGVQEWMLPRLVDRPLALLRCPEGFPGKCFFQRNWSETMPPAIDKVEVGERKKHERHVVVHDLAGLISLVQIGILEIHTWNCGSEDTEHPDQLIFDLDPGPDVSWKKVVEGTRTLNRLLTSLKLPTFLKTSGGKGLHLTIPIEPNIDWASAKSFCKTIAEAAVQSSGDFVANMRKDLRGGKIYIDYNRNDHFATAVAPYSTRGREGAPVSMPLAWGDLGKLKAANQFTVANAPRYLARRRKDPWADFDRSRVDLGKAVEEIQSK